MMVFCGGNKNADEVLRAVVVKVFRAWCIAVPAQKKGFCFGDGGNAKNQCGDECDGDE